MSISVMRQASDAILNVLAGGEFANPVCDLKQAALALQQAIAEAEKGEWVGLMDDEILGRTCACIDDGTFNMNCARDFARAIETKLKEQNT